ncbi:hypothetical protein LDFHOB_09680 [Candidatus Electronema aureum]
MTAYIRFSLLVMKPCRVQRDFPVMQHFRLRSGPFEGPATASHRLCRWYLTFAFMEAQNFSIGFKSGPQSHCLCDSGLGSSEV